MDLVHINLLIMKHINDILNESILDDDLDGNENAMKKKWVMDHLQGGRWADEIDKRFEVDKNGLISIDYVVTLELHEDMPDWIQFNDVYTIDYILFDKNRKSYKINLPKSTSTIKVTAHRDRKVPITLTMNNVKDTECTEFLISGVYDDIVFPKNMKVVQNIDLERTSGVNFTNINFPKSREISLPREDVVNFMKKMFHIKSDRIKF